MPQARVFVVCFALLRHQRPIPAGYDVDEAVFHDIFARLLGYLRVTPRYVVGDPTIPKDECIGAWVRHASPKDVAVECGVASGRGEVTE